MVEKRMEVSTYIYPFTDDPKPFDGRIEVLNNNVGDAARGKITINIGTSGLFTIEQITLLISALHRAVEIAASTAGEKD